MTNCKIQLPEGVVDISDIIKVSPRLETDLQALSKTPNYRGEQSTSLTSVSNRFRVLVRAIRFVLNEHEVESLVTNGLLGFLNDHSQLLKIVSAGEIKKELLQELVFALKLFSGQNIVRSDYSDCYILLLPKGTTEVTDLQIFSPKLVDDLKVVLFSERYQGRKGHSVKSISNRFRIVTIAFRFIITHSLECYRLKGGYQGLRDDGFKLLKNARKIGMRNELFNELLQSMECFFGEPILRHHYEPHLIPFYYSELNKWRYVSVAEVFKVLPNISAELHELSKSELSLLPQKPYNLETLHTRFSKLVRILLKDIAPSYGVDLKRHGLKALGINNNSIQKQLFQSFQFQVQNNEIARRTATGYCEVIRWVMSLNNQSYTDAFRISFKRHKYYAKREKIKNLYSDQELHELVFHLEKAISSASDTKKIVSLYFAKIQIKTCWNTAPMCDIALSDIQEIELPTSKKVMVIMLQKARKSYGIDTYYLDGRTVNSVMKDLKKVKDLTTSLRGGMKIFSDRLFIYDDYGDIECVDRNNIVSYINGLLESEGCSVRYNSQRIRKSGANHIYRDVLKDLRKYKDRMRHTYSTFFSNYHKLDEVKANRNLHDAVKVMEDYFTGREISKDIIILEQDNAALQKTPTGLCASSGNDQESLQYHKEHRKLHNEQGITDQWCSDYLACIWCRHFRTIADPDHVWQLLSYRDFVLSDMSSSVMNNDDNSMQTNAIKALKKRVERILTHLKSKNPEAIDKGIALQKQKGMHPYWSFAVTSISTQVVV